MSIQSVWAIIVVGSAFSIQAFGQDTLINQRDGRHRLCGTFSLSRGSESGPDVAIWKPHPGAELNSDRIIIKIDEVAYSVFEQLDTHVEKRGLTFWAEPNCACIEYLQRPAVPVFAKVVYMRFDLIGLPKSCGPRKPLVKRRV